MNSERNEHHQAGEPYLFGDHLALDLLNTQAEVNGEPFDFWNSSEDVFRWLERCGLNRKAFNAAMDARAFLAAAKELRATARQLIEQRKNGEMGNPARLNQFMRDCQTFPYLQWESPNEIRLVRRASEDTATQLLGSVAEAVAMLLAEGEFELVKQCEHPECVMWFYDRTKAHKRRWCSMALCGNRYKAAQFRKRTAGTQA